MPTKKIIRTIKIRLLPTKEQEQLLYEFAGACRFIWNTCLEYQIMHYRPDNETIFINRTDVNHYFSKFGKMLTRLKKTNEFKWLNKVPRHTLGQILKDLRNTYEPYYKTQECKNISYSKSILRRCAKYQRKPRKHERMYHPKFKRRKDNEFSIPFGCGQGELYFPESDNGKFVQIPGIQRVKIQYNLKESLPMGNSYSGPAKIKEPCVKLINGKWILFVAIEYDKQVPDLQKDKVIGIDLGLRVLAAATHCDENDDVKIFKNINKCDKVKRLEKQLRHSHRNLDRKYETNGKINPKKKYKRTRGVQKEINRMRKLYARLHNIRVNYLHQVSREIVNQLPELIVLEDFHNTLKALIHNRYLAKQTQNQMLGTFQQFLKYKCEEYGIMLIHADQFYPSTKTCSHCSSYYKIKQSETIYKCKQCGLTINRDINAAINLEKFGKNYLQKAKQISANS